MTTEVPNRTAPAPQIPEWDAKHRLPIDGLVGPHCADIGTVYRINSTFMDVRDVRQTLGQSGAYSTPPFLALAFMACIAVAVGNVGANAMKEFPVMMTLAFIMCACLYAGLVLFENGLFGLTRRPIRFHRKTRELYAIRGRRYFARGAGDTVWRIPWDSDQLFCVSRSVNDGITTYYIRHYAVDHEGKVVRNLVLGPGWSDMAGLLAQWAFWCRYMNAGPAALPRPRMYLAEREGPLEACLLAQRGHIYPLPAMLLFAPFTIVFASIRSAIRLTCRAPRWPQDVASASQVEPGDPYDQPRAGTPVGYLETHRAIRRGRYPAAPFFTVAEWTGLGDADANARQWVTDQSSYTDWVAPRPPALQPAAQPKKKRRRKRKR